MAEDLAKIKQKIEAEKKKALGEKGKLKVAKAALTKLKGSVDKVDTGLKAEPD